MKRINSEVIEENAPKRPRTSKNRCKGFIVGRLKRDIGQPCKKYETTHGNGYCIHHQYQKGSKYYETLSNLKNTFNNSSESITQPIVIPEALLRESPDIPEPSVLGDMRMLSEPLVPQHPDENVILVETIGSLTQPTRESIHVIESELSLHPTSNDSLAGSNSIEDMNISESLTTAICNIRNSIRVLREKMNAAFNQSEAIPSTNKPTTNDSVIKSTRLTTGSNMEATLAYFNLSDPNELMGVSAPRRSGKRDPSVDARNGLSVPGKRDSSMNTGNGLSVPGKRDSSMNTGNGLSIPGKRNPSVDATPSERELTIGSITTATARESVIPGYYILNYYSNTVKSSNNTKN